MENTSWIGQVFGNPIAASIVIVGILAIIVTVAILGKKGLLRVSIKGINIGNGETERMIVRQQIEYSKAAVDTFVESIGYSVENRYRARYIAELALDVIVEAIAYNHLTKDLFYVNGKVDKIWALVMKYATSPEYKSEEFKNKIEMETRKCFEHLVDLRSYYNKEYK